MSSQFFFFFFKFTCIAYGASQHPNEIEIKEAITLSFDEILVVLFRNCLLHQLYTYSLAITLPLSVIHMYLNHLSIIISTRSTRVQSISTLLHISSFLILPQSVTLTIGFNLLSLTPFIRRIFDSQCVFPSYCFVLQFQHKNQGTEVKIKSL